MSETTNETVTATADESVLDDDARMALTFMRKAVAEAERVSAGTETEAETAARIFETDEAFEKVRAALAKKVAEARASVPSETEVAETLKKAQKRYNAGLLAWESEDTPEGFVVPEFPRVKGSKSGGSATGRGAGVPRPRGLRAETAEHKGTEDKPLTCSTLAQKIGDGVTTASLLDAWKSEAGEDSEAWNQGQTATVTVTGKSGTEYAVTFTYKRD